MSLSPERRRLLGEFLRFAGVGAAGLAVDVGTLYLALHLLGTGPYLGRAISYVVAATFTWAANRRLTFVNAGQHGLLWQWARYLAVGAVGGLVNLGVYSAIVAVSRDVLQRGSSLYELAPFAGVVVGSAIAMLINFSGAKKLVFTGDAR